MCVSKMYCFPWEREVNGPFEGNGSTRTRISAGRYVFALTTVCRRTSVGTLKMYSRATPCLFFFPTRNLLMLGCIRSRTEEKSHTSSPSNLLGTFRTGNAFSTVSLYWLVPNPRSGTNVFAISESSPTNSSPCPRSNTGISVTPIA